MQLQLTDVNCHGINQLIVNQFQGENTPIVINFPYDVTGVEFEGTISFPSPVLLSIGNGIEVDNIINCVGSISDNTLTVTAITSGVIGIGSVIAGNDVISDTYVVELGTGTGGTGTYIINQAQVVSSTALSSSKVIMQLEPNQTQTVQEGQYPFDLWTIGTETPPVETPVLTGYFSILPTITVIT